MIRASLGFARSRGASCYAMATLVALMVAGSAFGGGGKDLPRSFVLKAARIMPVDPDLPWIIEDGVIIVRDGVIVAVGRDIEIPPDLAVVDLKGATILPGFVAAASIAGGGHSGHTGDESVAAGYRAVDAFDRYARYETTVAEGVTTIHISPGQHRLLTGVGAVVKLGGPPDCARCARQRVLRDQSDLTINLGEAVFNPPDHVIYHMPASSDIAITPAQRQRPRSRLGQILALDEAIEAAIAGRNGPPPLKRWATRPQFSIHVPALAGAWDSKLTLRIHVQRAVDVEQAISFIQAKERQGYLVGGAEAHRAANRIAQAGIPLVYRTRNPLRSPAGDIGYDRDAIEPNIRNLSALSDVKLALTAPEGQPTAHLRLAAATALRAGLDERKVIEAITRVPAEILGVSDRVGSLSPGKDADIVVMTGGPLATTSHVRRVYIGGRVVFEPPSARPTRGSDATRHPLVVRAGTVWVGPDEQIKDGAILIEDGKIVAVGRSVPHPPFARVIDAGPGGFVSPGFIDAHGHLSLEGDRSATPSDIALSKLIGTADVADLRVARSGVTTVMLSPYRFDSGGSQLSAIKTAGRDRDDRVVRDTAAVAFDVRSADPAKIKESVGKRLQAGKKYLEKWQKYEKELAEWLEKKKKGKVVPTENAKEEEASDEAAEDPITGIWQGTVTGGPLPEPMTGEVALKLTGTDIEGRVIEPPVPMEHKIVGTLDGDKITGEIQVDTEGMGYPQFEATLDAPDHLTGSISFQGISVDLEAERIEKKDVEFKVTKSKTRGKGGRPLPPKVDESLEPLKALLEKKIPAVVDVRTAAQIDAVIKLLVEEYELPTVLLNAEDAYLHAEALAEKNVGVIVPRAIVRTRKYLPYHQGDDLTRNHVPIAFQSGAEDGARSLPRIALYAVERGLAADAALAALTIDAARMLKIDDRVGALKPGRDGDLVVTNGHPFETGSAVTHVIINGQEVDR